MKKSILSLWYFGALALVLALVVSGSQLQAQQSSQPSDQPGQAQPAQPPSQSPSTQSAPDSQAQSQSSATQTFSGTIVKSGDKYVLQDASSGASYDIDRQDLVKKYEGQKVRIHGTLDSSGKMIQVQ